MRRRKQRKRIIIILCFLLLLMTVGYATFQTKIKVTGNTKITSNWDIRITNVTEANKTGNGESTNVPMWTNLTAYMEADLYAKGDSVEYDVTIENKGTLDAELENIISKVKSNNEAVKISFSGYAKGEKLYKNTKKLIKVKIEYNPNFNGKAEGSGEIEVSFDYGQAEGGTITPSTDKYLLTYDYKTNGGTDTAVYDEYVEQGQEISLGYSPVKAGYEFVGWNTDKDAMIGLKSYQMPNQATTLYAIYRKKLTINYEKSTAVESINRDSDTCYLYNNDKTCEVTLPTITVNTGYTFLGWYNGEIKVGNANAKYSASTDVSLVAKASVNSYNVTYNYSTNGGTSSTKTSAKVNYNESVDLTPTATKTGWTFVGWNTNKDATSAITSLNMGTSNVTLYAIFKKEARTVTITFNRNNATSITPKGGSASTAASITQSCTIPAVYNNATQATTCNITSPTITAPTNTPTVVGWSTAADTHSNQWSQNTAKGVSGNATYYAQTTKAAVTRTATFSVQDVNAATTSNTSKSCTIAATYNGTAQGSTCTLAAATLTAKTGYTAIGWNTNKASTTSSLNSGANVTLSSNQTYYSITKNNTNLTATFNGNGATAGSSSLSCTRYNGASSCNVTLPAITRSGFTIHGWNTNKDATSGTAAGASVSLSANATYYAITSKAVTITFNRNNATSITPSGGSASTAASLTQSCTIKNSATTCNITSPTITAPTNTPTVVGWSTAADTHSNQWSQNTAKGVSGNATYYAQTTKAAITRTATFSVQDANAVTASNTSKSCTIAATYNNAAQGSTCTLAAATLTAKTGYTAIGWNTNKAATTSSLNSGANVTLSSNQTYYSITKNNTNLTGTFSLQDTNAATTSATSTSCTRYNGATSCSIKAPTLTAKTGYTAIGWNTNKAATTSSLNSGANVILSSNQTYYSITKNNTNLTATFNGNGATAGSTSGSCTRYNGASSCAVKSPSITRAGFTIHGWNTNKDATSGTAAGSNVSINTNTTYYAITSKAITVTFSKGSNVSAIGSTSGSCTIKNSATTCAITTPTITPNTGYTSVGWSTTNGATSGTAAGSNISVSGNATYYGNAQDKTAPSITLNPNTQTSYTNGTAVVVTLADSGSGVKAGQKVYYAWSTSATSEPAFANYLTMGSCPSGYVEIGGVCYYRHDASSERACLSAAGYTWDNTLKVCYNKSQTANKTTTAGKTTTLTVPASASNNLTGTYYLWIKSGISDVAGNLSSSKVSSSFKFDATAPKLSFTTSKTTKSITVTATASATSGIKTYKYSKDGGSTWVTGTGNTYTFNGLTHNTAYNIRVRVTGNTGKVTTANSQSVTTNTLAVPTFTETNEGEVTLTYPSGCGSTYTCSYNKGSDVTVTTNPTVYLGTNGNIVAKVTDGTNTVSSTYTVTRANFYVSSSGSDTTGYGTVNKPYSTIAKAYTSTVNTSSINVMNNITQTNTANFNGNKTITLKSYGNTNSIIRGSSFKEKFIYLTSGTLTLQDITLDGNNVTALAPLIGVNGASTKLNTKTKATLKNNKNTYVYDNNTANLNKCGGALAVVSGIVTIDDVNITNNHEAKYGGGIMQNSGTLNINGGTIQSNVADSDSGGIWVKDTTGTWQNMTIKSNSCTDINQYGDGGGVMVGGNSNIQLKSGTISGNTAKRNCGGICAIGNAKLTITGGNITGNKASGVGGGLMVGTNSSTETATIYLKGGTVTGNTAGTYGGGLYEWGWGTFDYTSGNIHSNTGGTNLKNNNVGMNDNSKYIDHQISATSPFNFRAPDVYKIVSAVNNNYAVGIQGDNPANGTNVRLWNYYGGTSQKWKIYVSEIRDNKSIYTFASQLSGNPHLWVAGNTNTTSGTNVVVYALHGNAGGFWWIEDASGYRRLRSKGGNNYLNLAGSAADGTNVNIFANSTSNAQKWKFVGV